MKAPISFCIITRDEKHLEKCIRSFQDYVEEINVLITNRRDKLSIDICKKLNVKYKIYTKCNDKDDKIKDFSDARNESFKMATQPWVAWCDSDDIIFNADKLIDDLDLNVTGIMYPYEYSYDQYGNVSCIHYRERVLKNDGKSRWINPVHEVCITDNPNFKKSDNVIWKHQRQYLSHPAETGRNLRILKDHIVKNPNDVRNLYYIGLEYGNTGDIDNSIKYLSTYIDQSGWPDERAMACYRLIDIFLTRGNYADALKFAFKSIEINDWFESFYHTARCFYFLQQWQKCIDFAHIALSRPQTETLLFLNNSDRYNIHVYLNVALNAVGDMAAALDSCEAGLIGLPNDSFLLNNKKILENIIKPKILPDLQPIDKNKLKIIFALGAGMSHWSPDTIKNTGNGGSEIMADNMSRELSALGHDVTVYAMDDGIYNGVKYIHYSKFENLSCDVLIVSRNAEFLDKSYNVNAHVRFLWCHDVAAFNLNSERLLRTDKVFALTNWHKENLMNVHNIHKDKIIVTRNGIDYNRFKKKVKKKNICINSSSPDRSWPVLLDCWNDIVEACPDAELHLCYGFEFWKKSAANDPKQLDLIKRLENAIKKTKNVVFHDRLNPEELATLFMHSKIHLYPTWWTETSCLSAMEAQAANCWIVTSPIAALNETCANYQKTKFINGEWTSKKYHDNFVRETVKILKGKN